MPEPSSESEPESVDPPSVVTPVVSVREVCWSDAAEPADGMTACFPLLPAILFQPLSMEALSMVAIVHSQGRTPNLTWQTEPGRAGANPAVHASLWMRGLWYHRRGLL